MAPRRVGAPLRSTCASRRWSMCRKPGTRRRDEVDARETEAVWLVVVHRPQHGAGVPGGLLCFCGTNSRPALRAGSAGPRSPRLSDRQVPVVGVERRADSVAGGILMTAPD